MASFTIFLSSWRTKVLIEMRRAGGVAIIDRSRMPAMDIFKVLGMGVAVRVKISTSERSFLKDSFCCTPNRCSSSIISKPKRLKFSLPCKILWVPTKISSLPSSASTMVLFCSLVVWKRDITETLTGQLAKRSLRVS